MPLNRKPRNDRTPFKEVKSKFTKALIKYNSQVNKGKKFCTYAEDTPEYKEIKELQERKYPTTKEEIQEKRDARNQKAKEARAKLTDAEKETLRRQARERYKNRTEEQKITDRKRAKEYRDRKKATK